MIKHIVMWKLKEFAEGNSKQKNIELIVDKLSDLKTKIKEIRQFDTGINFNQSDGAYDVVLSSAFDSEEDLHTYLINPDHKKVGEFISKVRETRAVVDYIE